MNLAARILVVLLTLYLVAGAITAGSAAYSIPHMCDVIRAANPGKKDACQWTWEDTLKSFIAWPMMVAPMRAIQKEYVTASLAMVFASMGKQGSLAHRAAQHAVEHTLGPLIVHEEHHKEDK